VDVILDIVSRLVDFAFDYTCLPLFSDGMFRRGFLVALIGGWVASKLGGWLLFQREKVRAFFRPGAIPVPSSRPGPSGMDRGRGCVSGMFMLFAAGVVLAACALSLFVALRR